MIGLFDSGVGGLTVAKEVLALLSEYEIIYFGDTARLPYGTKQAGLIKKWSQENIEWLIGQGAEIIIIACHTASSWAYDFLKIGAAKPIFDVVNPSIAEALTTTQNGRIGIIGTPGTIASGIYPRKIEKISRHTQLYLKACPLFVPIIEEGWMHKPGTKEIAQEYLSYLADQKIDTMILGCTHYPLLLDVIQEIVGPGVKIINPARALVGKIKDFLEKNQDIEKRIKKGQNHRFFFSSQPYHLDLISQLCLDYKIKGIVIDADRAV